MHRVRYGHFTLRQALRLVWSLGWADFTLKYRGSVLGYLWSFMVPLTRFLVIFFVFHPFVGAEIPHYPLYLFLGVIIWEHFYALTLACVSLPHTKASIIQKVRFPRFLLLFVTAWTHVLIFLTHITIFLLLALLFGISLTPSGVLYMILILFQMTCVALGIGAVLGAFVLKYRDLQHLWEIFLTIFFWLTPIMYPYRALVPLLDEFLGLLPKLSTLSLTDVIAAFVRFQPLSVILFDARRVLLYAEDVGIPTLLHAGLFTLFCLLIALFGIEVFRQRSRFFLEEY